MRKTVGILGGGIYGLSLANSLLQQCNNLPLTARPLVKVFEKSGRLGGWIKTIKKDGYLFESGPRSLRSFNSSNKELLSLIHDLNLERDIVTGDVKLSKKRFVFHDGKLVELPSSLLNLLTNRSSYKEGIPQGLLRDLWSSKAVATSDLSIYAMLESRLGKIVAENFVDPFISGIYGGDARTLSAEACFPKVYDVYQRHGSLIYGALKDFYSNASLSSPKEVPSKLETDLRKSSTFSFRNGMESLISGLEDTLATQGAQILKDFDCKSIRVGPTSVSIEDKDDRIESVDYLVSTLPSQALISICSHDGSVKPLVGSMVGLNDAADIAVVNFGFKKKPNLPMEGFGYLVASKEKSAIMGIVFDSQIFPQQQSEGKSVMTVMLNPKMIPDQSIAGIIDCSLNGIGKQWANYADRSFMDYDCVHAALHCRAIPQYRVGHMQRVERLEKHLMEDPYRKKLAVAGHFLRYVAVADIVKDANRLAAATLQKVVNL